MQHDTDGPATFLDTDVKMCSRRTTTDPAGTWHRCAVACAVVGACFSLAAGFLLSANYTRIRQNDTVKAETLDRMKLAAAERPGDAQLRDDIRRLDLEIRRDRIGLLRFARRGAWLLAAGLAVLVLAAKWAFACRKFGPEQPRSEPRAGGVLTGFRTALTATAFLAAFAAAGALWPRIDVGRLGGQAVTWPSAAEVRANWHRFRGPGGAGISAYPNVPLEFDVVTSRNILWKSPLDLPGHNSPVVWRDRVFLSGAEAGALRVYCFDASDGRLLWEGGVDVDPEKSKKAQVMEGTGLAAPTLATNGRSVCGIFATGDVVCFDLSGRRKWHVDLGVPETSYGYASSLEIYRNRLFVQYDQGAAGDGKSRLLAIDTASGRIAWAMPRPVPNSWTSPVLVEAAGRLQLVTCGSPWVIAYEPRNGSQIWRAACAGGDAAPSPVAAGNLVLAIEPYYRLAAVRADGRGDVTSSHVAWTVEDNISDICCPVSDGRLVFLLASEGTLTCYRLADGKKLWERDMKASFRASPSIVGDRLCVLSDKGSFMVLEAGEQYRLLSVSEFNEECSASPAFADGRMYVRTAAALYCVGGTE